MDTYKPNSGSSILGKIGNFYNNSISSIQGTFNDPTTVDQFVPIVSEEQLVKGAKYTAIIALLIATLGVTSCTALYNKVYHELEKAGILKPSKGQVLVIPHNVSDLEKIVEISVDKSEIIKSNQEKGFIPDSEQVSHIHYDLDFYNNGSDTPILELNIDDYDYNNLLKLLEDEVSLPFGNYRLEVSSNIVLDDNGDKCFGIDFDVYDLGKVEADPVDFKIKKEEPPIIITDTDGDGVPNSSDNCINTYNPNQLDSDGDGIGDVCDSDIDGDGVPNSVDNCVYESNPDQEDWDNDGIGTVCDDDEQPPPAF